MYLKQIHANKKNITYKFGHLCIYILTEQSVINKTTATCGKGTVLIIFKVSQPAKQFIVYSFRYWNLILF